MWFYKPGFPTKPDFDTTLVDACMALAHKWEGLNAGTLSFEPHKDDISDFFAQQSYVLLEAIQQFSKPLSPELVDKLSETYG